MIIYAQVDKEGKLHQFVGFANKDHAQPHLEKHAECSFIEVDFFGSPRTHYHNDGEILPIEKEEDQKQ